MRWGERERRRRKSIKRKKFLLDDLELLCPFPYSSTEVSTSRDPAIYTDEELHVLIFFS